MLFLQSLQPVYGCYWVSSLEYIAAAYQYVYTCLDKPWCSVLLYSSVYLY